MLNRQRGPPEVRVEAEDTWETPCGRAQTVARRMCQLCLIDKLGSWQGDCLLSCFEQPVPTCWLRLNTDMRQPLDASLIRAQGLSSLMPRDYDCHSCLKSASDILDGSAIPSTRPSRSAGRPFSTTTVFNSSTNASYIGHGFLKRVYIRTRFADRGSAWLPVPTSMIKYEDI